MADNNKILRQEDLKELAGRIIRMLDPSGSCAISLASAWRTGLRWSRNNVNVAADQRDITIVIQLISNGGISTVVTNQYDTQSLSNAVKHLEWKSKLEARDPSPLDASLHLNVPVQPPADVWSDNTYAYRLEDSEVVVDQAIQNARNAGVVSAGYLEVLAGSIYFYSNSDPNRGLISDYGELTKAQCSMTVRDPISQGSGWSGISTWDLGGMSQESIAKRSLEKCLASMNPVRVEPGRYTAILEPQAVSDLVTQLVVSSFSRGSPEVQQRGPFFLDRDESLGLNRSKLGLKVVDERISIWHNPSDVETGIISPRLGAQEVTWIKNGILNTLSHSDKYASDRLGETESVIGRISYRMSGGNSSIEDMISSSERAILVTRFSQPSMVHNGSMMSSGITRDGLWLIENGKITRALRNFRTLESPLFMLNNVEQLGVPTRVFHPGAVGHRTTDYLRFGAVNGLTSIIVPPIKVSDFTFSSSIDAV